MIRASQLLIIAAMWMLALWAPAFAYDEAVIRQLETSAVQLQVELRQLTTLPRNTSTKDAVQADRSALSNVGAKAKEAAQKMEGPLAEVSKQVEELGPVPEPGKTEPQSIAQKRFLLTGQLDRLQGLRKQLDLMALEAEQAEARLTELQREQFLQRIFAFERSIMDPRLWWDVLSGTNNFADIAMQRMRASWLTRTSISEPLALIIFPAGMLLLWLVTNRILPILFSGLAPAAGGRPEDMTALFKLWTAVWGGFKFVLAAVAGLILLNVALATAGYLPGSMETIFRAVFNGVASAIMSAGLLYVVCSPGRPERRLVAVGEQAARTLPFLAGIASFVDETGDNLQQLASSFNLPVSFVVGHSAVVALVLIVLLTFALHLVRKEAAKGLTNGQTPYFLVWTLRLMPLIWLLLVIAALALIFGFVAFSYFVASNLLSSLILIVAFGTVHALINAFCKALAESNSGPGNLLRRFTSWSEATISRTALLLRTLADVVLTVLAAIILIGMWTDVLFDAYSILAAVRDGFSIGSITVSPVALAIGLSVLVVGVLLTRSIAKWLESRVLRDTQLDPGVRNSIHSATSYAGYILAAILALTATGVDFSNVALIAGALGVGIGLGLQSIVNNFVSGLILLAERPMRVGDWVVTKAGEGIVKKINVRATEIETFDNATVIVPNSNLISDAVINWTHRDTVGRFTVAVSVTHGTDPKFVQETLLKIAQDHPKVMRHPAPVVQLSRISQLSLDFDLRGYTQHVFDGFFVASDIRLAIVEKLSKKMLLVQPQPPAPPRGKRS
jgi:potassium-dependent mechanosensitive channel